MDPIKQAAQFADQAADKSDRWLMIFFMILVLMGLAFLIRYLVKELSRHAEVISTMAKNSEENMKEIVNQGRDLTMKCVATITENNVALTDAKALGVEIKDELKDFRRNNT